MCETPPFCCLLSAVCCLLTACPEDTAVGEAEVNDTDGPVCEYCESCSSTQEYLVCRCQDNLGIWNNLGDCPGVCESNPAQFDSNCFSACVTNGGGVASETQPVTCEGAHVDGSCSSWSPVSEITFSAGKRHVDASFVSSLVADPDPLSACDDGYFLGGSSSFQVRGTSPGELLYELGLRNNDVVRTLNDSYINTYADAMLIFTRDYLTRGETEYKVKVNRSGTIVTLTYAIDP